MSLPFKWPDPFIYIQAKLVLLLGVCGGGFEGFVYFSLKKVPKNEAFINHNQTPDILIVADREWNGPTVVWSKELYALD